MNRGAQVSVLRLSDRESGLVGDELGATRAEAHNDDPRRGGH